MTVPLKVRREDLQLSRKQFAGATGVSLSLLKQLELGTYPAMHSPKVLRLFAELAELEKDKQWP